MSLIEGTPPNHLEKEENLIILSNSFNKDCGSRTNESQKFTEAIQLPQQQDGCIQEENVKIDYQVSHKKGFFSQPRRTYSQERQSKNSPQKRFIQIPFQSFPEIQLCQQLNPIIFNSYDQDDKNHISHLNPLSANLDTLLINDLQETRLNQSFAFSSQKKELCPTNKEIVNNEFLQNNESSSNIEQFESNQLPQTKIEKPSINSCTQINNFSSKYSSPEVNSFSKRQIIIRSKKLRQILIANKQKNNKSIILLEQNGGENLQIENEQKEAQIGSCNLINSFIFPNQIQNNSSSFSEKQFVNDNCSAHADELQKVPSLTPPKIDNVISAFEIEKTLTTEQDEDSQDKKRPMQIIEIDESSDKDEIEIMDGQDNQISQFEKKDNAEIKQFLVKQNLLFEPNQRGSFTRAVQNLEIIICEMEQEDEPQMKQSSQIKSQVQTILSINKLPEESEEKGEQVKEKKEEVDKNNFLSSIQNDSNIKGSQITILPNKSPKKKDLSDRKIERKSSNHSSNISSETVKLNSASKNFGEMRRFEEEQPEMIEYSEQIKSASHNGLLKQNFLSTQNNQFKEHLEKYLFRESDDIIETRKEKDIIENNSYLFSQPRRSQVKEEKQQFKSEKNLSEEINPISNTPILMVIEEKKRELNEQEENKTISFQVDLEAPNKGQNILIKGDILCQESFIEIEFSSIWESLMKSSENNKKENNCLSCLLSFLPNKLSKCQLQEKKLILSLSEENFSEIKKMNVELLEQVRILYRKFTTTNTTNRKNTLLDQFNVSKQQKKFSKQLEQDKYYFSKESSMLLNDMNIFSLIQMLAFFSSDSAPKLASASRRVLKKVNLLFLLLRISNLVVGKIKEDVLDDCLKTEKDLITLSNKLFNAVYSEAIVSVIDVNLELNQTNVKLYEYLDKISKKLTTPAEIFYFLSNSVQTQKKLGILPRESLGQRYNTNIQNKNIFTLQSS